MALADSLASRCVQSCPGAEVGPCGISWHLGCGGDELQQGGSWDSSDFPSPKMMLRAGAKPPQGRQSLMSSTLALYSHSRPGLLPHRMARAQDALPAAGGRDQGGAAVPATMG